MYPVEGFIISGDPAAAVPVSGCSKSHATEATTSRIRAQDSASRNTSKNASHATKPLGGGKPSLVQSGSSKPSTSKAHQVRTDTKSVKIPPSGAIKPAQTKSTALKDSLPEIMQGEHTKNDSTLPEASPSASTVTTKQNPRHKNPSKRAFTTRRSAYKITQRLGAKPVEELTEQEKNSLQWAKTHLESLESVASTTADNEPSRALSKVAPKRQRSGEDTLPGTKRSKNAPTRHQNRSYKEVAKDNLMWAIIDRNSSDGTISSRNWRKVVNALSGEFMKFLRANPGPPPQCTDVGWYQGHIKLIACADERSAQLYKAVIESLGEVWPGVKLEAIDLADVPQRPRSVATIPAVPSDPKEILEILQVSNPHLPTGDWKVVRVTEPKEDLRKATIIINSDSLPLLREAQGKVYYGFGNIFLRVYKGDDKEKPLAQPDEGQMSLEDAESVAYSSANEDTQSTTGCVGEFFGRMEVTEDEDALLEDDDDDPENADVTVVHNDGLC